MLTEALDLWTKTAPYRDFPAKTIAWRLLPAIEHDRCMIHRRDGEVIGFSTWAFLTPEEAQSNYDGPTVFAREDGPQLWVIDMVTPGGPRDVAFVARELRSFFHNLYPHHTTVYAHRGDRVGWFPNKGN